MKGANPEYGVGDIAKELGRRWADAEPETKSKYEAMAEKDKARYEKVSFVISASNVRLVLSRLIFFFSQVSYTYSDYISD